MAMNRTSPGHLRKGFSDFCLLLKGNLLELRMSWTWYLAFASFDAVMFLIFMWLVIGRGNPDSILFVITGSLTQSLTMSGMLSLGQDIGRMKEYAVFDYYATLPISKTSFIMALVGSSLLRTLPSMILCLAFATVVLNVPIRPNVLLPITALLGGFSLVGIGAVIGFYSKTGRIASYATQIVSPILTYLAPVFYPAESLPRFLQITSRFVPTTYVARLLRAGLSGGQISSNYPDLAVLALFTWLSIGLVFPRLDWRSRKN